MVGCGLWLVVVGCGWLWLMVGCGYGWLWLVVAKTLLQVSNDPCVSIGSRELLL